MDPSVELEKLITEYGSARDRTEVGDQVLGVGVSEQGRYIEHGVVKEISGSSATIRIYRRIYIDKSNQGISSNGLHDGEEISNVPLEQFRTSIKDRLLSD